MPTTTHHAYADTLHTGDRLAATQWGGRHGLPSASLADAVAATLRLDPDAIILRAVRGTETVRGYAPAGMVA
jgi:hypothetical protein